MHLMRFNTFVLTHRVARERRASTIVQRMSAGSFKTPSDEYASLLITQVALLNRRLSMLRITNALLVVTAVMLAACSGAYGSPTAPPGDARTVSATPSLTFGPSSLMVHAGDVVTFAFGSVAHNVFFDQATGAPADIAGLNANVSIQRTFATPGTYSYTCHIHPSMHGTVVVQ
jgi:plastocyanin